jgi:23S rRNA pseudouridine2605 synthase
MPRKSTENGELTGRPEKVGERVAKVIARAGLGSRREGEEMIAAGRVAINGTVIDTPAINVTPGDTVTIDGKPLPVPERTRLFLYHKPRGLVTSHNDPQERATVFGALPKHLPRLLSVGRLDFNTEGLLLLTNDGGLARILELPDTGWLRRYRVRAHGRVTQPDLDALRNGITIEGMHYGPIEAKLDREQGSNVWITIGIREGKNREVRNVLSHLGLLVTRLIRVSFGPFQLGEVPEGEVEEVKTRILREQLGEKLAAQAGVDFSGPISEHEEAEAPRRPARERSERAEGAPRPYRDSRPERGRPGERNERGRPAGKGERPQRGRDDFNTRQERLVRERGEAGPGRPGARDDRRAGFGPPRAGRPDRGDDRRGRDERPRREPGREGDPQGSAPEGTQFSPPETRKQRPTSGHVWRQREEFHEAPPRKGGFRGPRRDDRADESGGPEREKKSGVIADRKGRTVVVERYATAEPEPDRKERHPKEPKRFGKGMRREHPADAARNRPSGPPRERSDGAPGKRPFGPKRAGGPPGEKRFGGKREHAGGAAGERPSGGRRERPSGPPRERSSGPKRDWSSGPKRERSSGPRDRTSGPRSERPSGPRGERPSGPGRERASGPGRGRSSGPGRDRPSGPRPDRPPRGPRPPRKP